MGFQNRLLPHAVLIKTAGGAVNQWINQIESLSPDEGVALFEESSGSATDREFVAAKDIAPVMPFTTSDLSALATVGFSGCFISNDGSNPGAAAYGRLLPLGGLPSAVASTVHLLAQVSDGLVVPVSIRAAHGQVAKLSLMLNSILGTGGSSLAAPMVVTSGVAIPTGAAATANIYTAGPVKYTISGGASRLVQGVMDLGVTFGIQVLKESSDGDVFPTHISIISRMPSITFTTKDAAIIAEIGNGVAISAFASYFRNVAADGQRTPAATTSHVSVAGVGGMVTQGSVALTHKTAGASAFTFTPRLNGSLLTVSTTAAIPTS